MKMKILAFLQNNWLNTAITNLFDFTKRKIFFSNTNYNQKVVIGEYNQKVLNGDTDTHTCKLCDHELFEANVMNQSAELCVFVMSVIRKVSFQFTRASEDFSHTNRTRIRKMVEFLSPEQ